MSALLALQKKLHAAAPPLIGLGGAERAFVDEALDMLRKRVVNPESASLNHVRLSALESDLSQLAADLYTMPFLANLRLIEIHTAEKLDEGAVKTIINYIEKPSISTVLVIVFDKIDKRNKLVSALDKAGCLYVFEAASGKDIVDVICRHAQSLNMVLKRDIANLIAIMLDNDVLAIKSALAKLALIGEGREITERDVEEHVCVEADQDVFVLARSIAEGKLSDSLYRLGLVKNNQENAIKFFGVLVWQMRVILHICHCFERGMTEQEAMKQVSVYGDRFRSMAHIARKKNIAFHINRLTRLIECDALLKSLSTKEPFNLIEKVVYQSALGL